MTKVSHLHPGSLNTISKSNVFKLIPKTKDLRAPQTSHGIGLVYALSRKAKGPGEMPLSGVQHNSRAADHINSWRH